MGRVRAITILILTAVLMAAAAEAQTGPPADDRFVLGARVGVQTFHYKETNGAIKSDFNSVGPAVGINASFKVVDRLRLNFDYLGSFIQEDRETWWNIGTVAGFPVTQQNDVGVDFHVFDLDVSYSFLKTPQFEWALALGWQYYLEDFSRSNFRFLVSTITIPTKIAPVSEDVMGQGAKIRTTLEFRATNRLTFTGGLGSYWVYRVSSDNSALGTVNSNGYAVRWRLSADYRVHRMVTVGVGYEGHLIKISEGRSAIAILPKNETFANTFTASVAFRF